MSLLRSGGEDLQRTPAAQLLVRVMVGSVFLAEGIQKFLFADALGAGRFAKIGIPAPEIMGPFVGIVEVVCGALLIAGLLTRLAAVPLAIDILVAIATTKIPMLLQKGFWPTVHESRVDGCMLLGLIVIIMTGAGAWSVDAVISPRPAAGPVSAGTP